MERCAKIVATIGPASEDEDTLRRLMQAGMDVARLNFSHGTQEHHSQVYHRLRSVAESLGRPIAILQDLQGPKIRTGELEGGEVQLAPGQDLTLTTEHIRGNPHIVPVDFPQLLESVKPGGRILLDDGNLELKVNAVSGNQVETVVVQGGTLKPHKGVNLPGADICIPGFTEKDRSDLSFGLALGVDAVAVSFVRSEKDIQVVRDAILSAADGFEHVAIIAKLERPEALENLEAIIEAADGVMVARGDLGVEMPPETVPIAQKRIIASANRHAKVVITATQMLDSMIHNPRPTRAEASDVANAVFDGTDAVMLSGETASGSYPVQAVEFMDRIVSQAEAHMADWGHWRSVASGEVITDDTFFITQAARELAHDRNVAAVAVFTQSGRTALMMSKARPIVPILAFTPERRTYPRLNLYWGVSPHLVPHAETIDAMLASVDSTLIASTNIEPGQQVVLICGYPVDRVRSTNMALLHTVGERD